MGTAVTIIGLVVGLSGVALAALSLLLAHRERVAAFRAALYGRQLESIAEVTTVLAALHQAAIGHITDLGITLTLETRAELRGRIVDEWRRFGDVTARTSVFLPKTVTDALGRYNGTLLAISAPAGRAGARYRRELVEHNDPSTPLSEVYGEALEAIRHQVGTEALSAQTLALLGQPPRPGE